MSAVVVFAFAVQDGLLPVPGAAPFDVLARQLARTLVARLNVTGDRGLRFFPFLGPVDGQRDFLRMRELLDPHVLGELHKQGEVDLLVDGLLLPGLLHWRLIDGRSLELRTEAKVPFDPRRPLDVLPRLEFEVGDVLGWNARPLPPSGIAGEALGWLLVLRDELLRREAKAVAASPDPLRAARRCVELAPGDAEVRQVVLEFAVQMLRQGESRAGLANVLAVLLPACPDDADVLERLGALLFAAGDEATAATALARAATLAPERTELVERASAQLFRAGRFEEVRTVVDGARRRGVASASALAQCAAACDRLGDDAARAVLVGELVGMNELPVPVARLVVSFLLEDEQAALARTIVQRALGKDPQHAVLHFELGRACLLLDDGGGAMVALQRALELGLQPVLAGQARRFLRLASVPGLWHGTQSVEKAIAAADLVAALASARSLVRRAGSAAEAWFLLGVVAHKMGQERRAELALRRAVRRDESFAEAHNRLGILLVAVGRLEQGLPHLQRAHRLAPNDPSPLLHLAQAMAMRGQREDAEAYVAAAARLGADPQLVAAVRREFLAEQS
ncbi:MAG: hypothetical protein IT455_00615 [Planctomycetes bacterium]|nr:hypothetical protein [Planctomycetota bacterium]